MDALTAAERKALHIVAAGRGQATWYQVERQITPPEFPGQETNSIRLLARLEQLGLIAKAAAGGKLQPFAVTDAGTRALRSQ